MVEQHARDGNRPEAFDVSPIALLRLPWGRLVLWWLGGC